MIGTLTPFLKGGGFEFSKVFQKGGRIQNFPTKMEGLVKMGISLTLTLAKVIFFSLCGAFCSDTISVSILCVSEKELILENLISKYVTSTSE